MMHSRRLTPPGCRPSFDGDAPETDADLVCVVQAILRSGLAAPGRHDGAAVAAWERFYRTYDPLIRAMVRARPGLRGAVPDAAQEVWCSLIVRLPGLRFNPRRGRFEAWLTAFARHALTDYARKRHARTFASLEPESLERLAAHGPDPAELADRSAPQERVREIFAAVPAESCQILRMRWVEQHSVSEIGRRLSLTPEQVRYRHYRALKRLRTALGRSSR